MIVRDPVWNDGEQYFFWDETWCNFHGPFKTEEEAREELRKYGESL